MMILIESKFQREKASKYYIYCKANIFYTLMEFSDNNFEVTLLNGIKRMIELHEPIQNNQEISFQKTYII